MTLPAKVLLTAQEVAEVTGLPVRRIYDMARDGEIPVRKVGRSVRFSAKAIEDWADKQPARKRRA